MDSGQFQTLIYLLWGWIKSTFRCWIIITCFFLHILSKSKICCVRPIFQDQLFGQLFDQLEGRQTKKKKISAEIDGRRYKLSCYDELFSVEWKNMSCLLNGIAYQRICFPGDAVLEIFFPLLFEARSYILFSWKEFALFLDRPLSCLTTLEFIGPKYH